MGRDVTARRWRNCASVAARSGDSSRRCFDMEQDRFFIKSFRSRAFGARGEFLNAALCAFGTIGSVSVGSALN
jgi:hypothetical protein